MRTIVPTIKQEVREFHSRTIDGTRMYPGKYLLTSVRVPWGWQLIGWEEFKDASDQTG